MPKSCKVWGCTNHNLKTVGVSYYQFPSEPSRLSKWVTAINVLNRDGSSWWPKKPQNIHVCSDHFVTGKPSTDPSHVDYIPSLLPNRPRNTSVSGQRKLERLERTRKRSARRVLLRHDVPESCRKREEYSDEKLGMGRDDSDMILDAENENLMVGAFETVDETANDETTSMDIDIPSPISPVPSFDHHQYAYALDKQPSIVSTPLLDCERAALLEEIDHLRSERDEFKETLSKTQTQSLECNLKAQLCFDKDDISRFYTGLSSGVLKMVFDLCMTNTHSKSFTSCGCMSPEDQLLMCIIRLRHNIPLEYLSRQKGINLSTASDVFTRWIDILHEKIGWLVRWPDREALIKTLPREFKKQFPRLTAIADCFEVFIERPSKLEPRAQCYSNYKHHSTIKVFIACSPLGAVTYLSCAWGGRVSDVEIVRQSNFISPQFHHPGDQILVDRGFTLKEDFATLVGVELIMPAFTKGKSQLSAEDVGKSRVVSNVRIHIERVIGLIRNRYRILKGPLKVSDIKSLIDEASDVALARADKIVVVCGALTNLGDGIV